MSCAGRAASHPIGGEALHRIRAVFPELCNNPLAEPQDPKAPDGRSAARLPVVVPGLGGRGDVPSLGVRRAALAHVVQNRVEAAGTDDAELQVAQVVLRIHPAPEAPHGATADFDLVHLRDEQEIRRKRWSLTLRFEFLDRIPPDLVVYNPMGILITYLQADQALVTGDAR